MSLLRSDPDHDAVCLASGRHLVVVAPPGTGKTCLSVRLAGEVARELVPPARVLLVTFSNQARIQLEHEAARQLTPDLRQRVQVTNYHSFFWRAVMAHRRALGLPLGTQMTSRRRRIRALKQVDKGAVSRLRRHEGLLEGLAEHRFQRFRDERTPDAETLDRLLVAVEHEQRNGRLVFDDLGALLWALLEEFPTLDDAYSRRYPIVIADEHQDASALQDAVVRRLGQERLIVLADPMQLIYGFRGSRPERLERHLEESDGQYELRTPHRWHGEEAVGRWLLALRARLQDRTETAPPPASLKIVRTPAQHGLNSMKPRVKEAVSRAFRDGGASAVAVLAAWNSDVAQLRGYLSKEGLYPRQLGGDDFEEAREDIEQLPLYGDVESVAHHAIARVKKLVPTLPNTVVDQVKRRLGPEGVNLGGRCGDEAAGLLRTLEPLYEHGSGEYVGSVVAALDSCARHGHHLPRVEAVRALRTTADALVGDGADLNAVLERYADRVAASAQAAPRLQRGLFVMTSHQAKGKEFDVMILVNADADRFPDTDEGRRLFYVSITRGSTVDRDHPRHERLTAAASPRRIATLRRAGPSRAMSGRPEIRLGPR